LKAFLLCFVPLFVAVDAIGILPLFLTLTRDTPGKTVHRIIGQSVCTAAAVALLFALAGPALLRLLGITVADFMIAGGILLFVVSMRDITTTDKSERRLDTDGLGAVPLGVPLITGPAVLTTSILLVDQQGFVPTSAALVVNILIVGTLFWFGEALNRVLGKAGAGTLSKISSLLLAAIGVMLVRKGIAVFLAHAAPP
jgi:multiple antibiotic resistance protein